MIEFRPIPVILTSFYCFLVGLFSFSASADMIFGKNVISDPVLLTLAIAIIIFGMALITVGIGILYYNQLCWKILFFFLVILIVNVVSIFLVVMMLLWLDAGLFYKYYQSAHITAQAWFTLLFVFLSGIFALNYITRKEVVSYFGEMGELIDPF